MHPAARLGLYGLGLVAAFGVAFLVADVVAPEPAADTRPPSAEHGHGHRPQASGGPSAAALPGLSLEAGGFRLGPVSAPAAVDEEGELRFVVLDAAGAPVLEYTEEHEQDLHLIVVREDGSEFRHVHPERSSDGTWSIPWSWSAAGTYRVFADFVPAGAERGFTLSRSVSVAGPFEPVRLDADVRAARAGEYDVELVGDLVAGGGSTLTIEVTHQGAPVTSMEPYLGAFGHLVALREGDLAYLHVHPEGAAPEAGQRSGPTVDFATEAPTPGRYLLYFDFQVDGEVHTASFVLSTDAAAAALGGDGAEEPPAEEAPAEDGHDDDHGH